MDRLNSIQFLRALAALVVVLYHAIGRQFGIGAAGVDVFFVISGFIMGTYAKDIGPRKFLEHRVVRIVPLYWAVTLLMCVGAMAGVFSSFTFDLPRLWQSLLFIPYQDGPLVEVGWTLNLEMLFYLVFALGLWLKRPLLFSTLVLGFAAVVGTAVEWQNPILFVWTSPLLLEFLAGLLLSQWRPNSASLGWGLLLVGLVGFVAAQAIGEQAGILRVISWGGPALCLVAGCIAVERAGRWPSAAMRPAEALGDASYALYLLHGVLISAVHKVFAPGLLATLVVLAVSVSVSLIVHRWVEKPMTRFLRRLLDGGKRKRGFAARAADPV